MAINKNHEFEDLDGVKCAIVERNVTSERLSFIKPILEYNGYIVIVSASPAPKAPPVPAADTGASEPTIAPEPIPTFTVGVTNVVFNITNAIMGRALHNKEGKVVTADFWYQRNSISLDEIPYFEKSGKW